ncbi:MAG: hypothetical protein HY905_02495 [Deltaproteobacteria bacterium]|nr:hypothetical protein [Deltaproteobacteria bacterium]
MVQWRGHEIDGSDTTFQVDLHGRGTAAQAALTALALPLWRRDDDVIVQPNQEWAPHRSVGERPTRLPFPETLARLGAGALAGCDLVVNARHPDEVEPELLARLAGHSAGREPNEPAFLLARRPELLPDGVWFSPNVGFAIPGPLRAPDERPLAAQLLDTERLQITLGPTVLYE